MDPLLRSASLTVFGASPRPATVTVVRLAAGPRLARALKAGGVFWAIAAVCVFLPGLHFILVPSFLSIGLVAGFRHMRDQEIVARVSGVCPRCEAEQEFAAGNRLTPTWSLDCSACHNTLTLTLEERGAPQA